MVLADINCDAGSCIHGTLPFSGLCILCSLCTVLEGTRQSSPTIR